MQPPSQERKTEDKNENKLRIQEVIANGYMDNSRWKTSGTNFRGKTIKRVYSSWKDLPKATAYLAFLFRKCSSSFSAFDINLALKLSMPAEDARECPCNNSVLQPTIAVDILYVRCSYTA